MVRAALIAGGILLLAIAASPPATSAARRHATRHGRVCKTVKVRAKGGHKRRVRVCARRKPVHKPRKPRVHTHSGGFQPPMNRETEGDEGDSPPLPVGPFRRPRSRPITVPLQGAQTPRRTARAAGTGVTITSTRLLALSDFPASTYLPTGVQAAQEPSVASGGGLVMYALNWDAGYSTDGGQSFTEMDPHTVFPSNPGGFCCDQVVVYDAKADRFIWLLQYNGSGGENVIRVAYASPRNVLGFGAGAWKWFDLPSSSLAGKGKFLDQPKVGMTDRYVYMNINQADSKGVHKTLVVRVPHVAFAGQVPMGYGSALVDPWSLRVAQNVNGATAYFVGHKDTSTLRVVSIDDNANYLQMKDIKDQSIADHNWSTPTPGGDDMLARQATSQGSQITGVTQDGDGNLWTAWSEGRDVVDKNGHVVARTGVPTEPHIGVAVLSVAHPTLGPPPVIKLKSHWDYWNFNFSLAMPDLATTADGEVGIVFNYGGGPDYLEHTVGFLSGGPTAVTVQASNSDSTWTGNAVGDYQTLRPQAPPRGNCLMAAGAVNQGSKVGYPALTVFSRNGVNCKTRTPPPGTVTNPPVTVAPPRDRTSITLSCPPEKSAGERYPITGRLSPAIGGAPITLTYTSSDTSVAPATHKVSTAGDGTFSDTAQEGPAGTERIDAKYGGDSRHNASSQSCRVTIQPSIG